MPRRPTSPEERLGEVLGNYKVLDLLGRGGMGCVYLAEHIKLGRRVALKLLRSDHAQRRDAVARFFQEARSVNRIRHRNIVDVTDFVELDEGTTFLVMELLDGVSLGKRLRSGGLDGPRALALLIQICDGLEAAHAMGVVHRDLKPDNIFVVPTGDGAEIIKLLDFGVAKLMWREEDEDFGFETAAGAVVGTPTYMSPEQAGGLEIDPRSDIYSVGAIMYEMFTGEPVFRGKSFGEYVRKHLNEQPVPPRRTARGRHLDERLDSVIMTCLAKRREDRFQHIGALKNELMIMLGAIETGIPDSVSAVISMASTPAPASIMTSGSQLGAPAIGAAATTAATGAGTRSGAHLAMATATAATTSGAAWMPSPHQPPTPYPPQQFPAASDTAMALGDLPGATRTGATRRRGRWLPIAVAGLGLFGGAIAIALAVTDREGGESSAPAAARSASPTPMATTIEARGDQPEAAAGPFTVRFVASPPASVYAIGDDLPTCTTTPCDVTVDPESPGPVDWRTFRFIHDGYEPKDVRVSLKQRPRTLTVTLRTSSGAASSTRTRRPARNPDHARAPALVQPKDDSKPTPADDLPASTTKPAVDHSKTPGKTPGTPVKKKPGGRKIDPSESLDPFGTP